MTNNGRKILENYKKGTYKSNLPLILDIQNVRFQRR